MPELYGDPKTGFLEAGGYPGSSGRWATDPTYGPSGGMRNGLYPGDASRIWMGKPTLAPGANRILSGDDEPYWDTQRGMFISHKTGMPFSGKTKNGVYVVNGISHGLNDPAAIDPNNPAQRYQPVEIPKSPDISSSTKDLVQQFKDTAEQSLKGFDDHLKSFQDQVSGASTASKAAIDAAGPTANALTTQQRDFANSLNSARTAYAGVNANTAAKQDAALAEARGLLPSYDKAGQDIADRQIAEAVKNLSRYKIGSGTPSSLGGDETRILASAASDALLPLKQSEINRRYDIISGLEMPNIQDQANRGTALAANFDPMVAGQIYQTGTGTTQQLQALKEHVAGMSYDNAERSLRDMGIPAAVINQVLAGNISNLSGLAGLEDQTNYRGLQDKLGVNVSQPIYYDQSVPGYPSPSRYSPTNTGTQPALGPNAPVQSGPGNKPAPRQPNAVDIAYKQQTGFFPWDDPQYTNEVYQLVASRLQGTSSAPDSPNASAPRSRYRSGDTYVDMTALDRNPNQPDWDAPQNIYG